MIPQTFVYLSPHLDDVAFSACRHLIAAAERGRRCIVATVFTASVNNPVGFALRCQTDKGIDAGVDYMALRRAEDRQFVEYLNDRLRPAIPIQWVHGDLPEAPHRGYDSPAELFREPASADPIVNDIYEMLIGWNNRWQPDRWIGPSGFGHHIDHRCVIDAISRLRIDFSPTRCSFDVYRDSPYVVRNPDAVSIVAAGDHHWRSVEPDQSSATVAADAVAKYESQLKFQFGGEQQMRQWFAEHRERIGYQKLLECS